jgi:predicted nucleotidyltransferase
MMQNSHPISKQKITSIAYQIANKFNPLKIVLFGSYATGNYHTYSDVDLLVVLDEDQTDGDPEIKVMLSVPHQFPMDIIVRSPDQIEERRKKGDTFLSDIIKHGIVLYERFG